MNVHDLEALVVVVDRGGLSAAAAALGVTTSAVSRRIRGLEDALGAQLLHRTTRHVEPTEAGRRVVEHARQALDAVQLARDAAREEQREVSGRVRVVSLMAFGRLHVTPLLAEVRREYPSLELDVVLDDRRGRILERDFDIAIVVGMPRSDSLFVTHIAELGSVLCASPAYVERHGAPADPAALEGRECIIYSYSGAPDCWRFTRDGETTEVRVAGGVRVNNSEVVAELVQRGIGIGRVPEFVAGPLLASGALIDLFPGYAMATVPLLAVTQRERPLPRRMRVVLDRLVDALRREPWASRCP